MQPAIETRGLTKAFGSTRAVNGIDLRIARGSVYGLLGPNGAGKTTTIRILATLLRPDAGTARVLGHDVAREAAAVRAKVSLTGQFASVDEDLTGRENLVLVARLLGFAWSAARARADELLEAFEPDEAANRQVRSYSGGMRRRLDIAASAVSAALTLGWRALLKIKHVPFQLFDVTAFPLMMTLMFTFLFGGALAGSPREYVQYLLPGILVQTIVFITVYTGVGLNTDISKGLFDRFRSLPIWQPAPIAGALLGDVLRYSTAALMVIGLGLVLGFRPGAGVVGVVLAVALIEVFAFAVSWIWIVVGMLVKTPESVMTSSFLVLFPLTFASNIFVDPATMPGWLQAVVGVNPVTHLAEASRGLMHGGVAPASVAWVLAASAAIVAVFAPLSLRMYRKER